MITNSLLGKRVRLISMNDPHPIEKGMTGTIKHIGGGVINVNWDNGRYLGLIEDCDEYEIIEHQNDLSINNFLVFSGNV